MIPTFAFQWHITDACDQRCLHCYIYGEDGGKVPESMTWQQMEMTLANMLDFCARFHRQPYVYLTGGDPILHPDFWRLLERFRQQHIPFAILGNPFHLTDAVCRRLRELGCRKYQLSLDGLRETHDRMRRPGSFEETLEKIPCIRRAGMTSVIMTTVSGANLEEIPELIDVVVEHHVDVYAFARWCPTGSIRSNGLEPRRYRQLLETCDRKFRELAAAGCTTFLSRKDHLWTLYEYETGAFSIPEGAEPGVIYGGCNCGNCHLTVLPNGDVYACRRVEGSRVGNVLQDPLADLWVREMEAWRDYDRFEKCAGCPLMPWCRGCPAVAHACSGDFYGPDPQCWREPAGEEAE